MTGLDKLVDFIISSQQVKIHKATLALFDTSPGRNDDFIRKRLSEAFKIIIDVDACEVGDQVQVEITDTTNPGGLFKVFQLAVGTQVKDPPAIFRNW